MNDIRLPVKKVGLCAVCGKEIDVYPEEKSSGIVWYKIDAHEACDGKLCAGSKHLPAGKPMLRHASIESPENVRMVSEKFTVGW